MRAEINDIEILNMLCNNCLSITRYNNEWDIHAYDGGLLREGISAPTLEEAVFLALRKVIQELKGGENEDKGNTQV